MKKISLILISLLIATAMQAQQSTTVTTNVAPQGSEDGLIGAETVEVKLKTGAMMASTNGRPSDAGLSVIVVGISKSYKQYRYKGKVYNSSDAYENKDFSDGNYGKYSVTAYIDNKQVFSGEIFGGYPTGSPEFGKCSQYGYDYGTIKGANVRFVAKLIYPRRNSAAERHIAYYHSENAEQKKDEQKPQQQTVSVSSGNSASSQRQNQPSQNSSANTGSGSSQSSSSKYGGTLPKTSTSSQSASQPSAGQRALQQTRQNINNINQSLNRNGSQSNLNKATQDFANALSQAFGSGSSGNDEDEREEQRLAEAEAAEEARLEAERRHAAMVTSRNDIFKTYADGAFPASTSKLSGEVWYFAYRVNRSAIENAQATVYVTNAFPIAKYKDGTFPQKRAVVDEIAAAGGTGETVVVGHFASQDEALQAQSGFTASAQNTGMTVKDLNYKGKAATGSTDSKDFWGVSGNKNDTKTPAKTNTETKKKDSFWDK